MWSARWVAKIDNMDNLQVWLLVPLTVIDLGMPFYYQVVRHYILEEIWLNK